MGMRLGLALARYYACAHTHLHGNIRVHNQEQQVQGRGQHRLLHKSTQIVVDKRGHTRFNTGAVHSATKVACLPLKAVPVDSDSCQGVRTPYHQHVPVCKDLWPARKIQHTYLIRGRGACETQSGQDVQSAGEGIINGIRMLYAKKTGLQ